MSSIFKNKGIYYLKITYHYKRIVRSLQTKDKRIAKQRAKILEPQLFEELIHPSNKQFLPFNDLIKKYLQAEHNWSKASRDTTIQVLKKYKKGIPLPENEATRIGVQGRLNAVINWGKKNGFTTDLNKYKLKKKPARNRVFTDIELVKIFKHTRDLNFRRFVQFAYYTGARRSELCNMKQSNIYEKYFKTFGKTGERLVRLNTQAKDILYQQGKLWEYETDYVTHHFKKNLRRIGIEDGCFHDLRRTFGLNLIKSGMPIYTVSKLLGHSSISTTEWNYAPLLVTDIGDFSLPVNSK
tara:strand:+ start:108 stop:995 length:888 start_codon:yes stop_codon:yes gene_type:complete